LDNGNSWQAIGAEYLGSGDLDAKEVEESNYHTYQATWNAAGELAGVYCANAKIRVTIDDHEGANNITRAETAEFILDAKPPLAGTPAGGGVGININQNILTNLGNDKTASTTVELYFAANDDSEFKIAISNSGVFEEANYQDYNASRSWELEGEDGLKTVYVMFKDSYGNTAGPYSDTIELDRRAPATPISMFIQDISNILTEAENATSTATTTEETGEEGGAEEVEVKTEAEYRLFCGWQKAPKRTSCIISFTDQPTTKIILC